jgi:hypothetical protein
MSLVALTGLALQAARDSPLLHSEVTLHVDITGTKLVPSVVKLRVNWTNATAAVIQENGRDSRV